MRNLNADSNTTYSFVQGKLTVASALSLQRTRGLFFALCCYLFSQSFTIPIFAIGPSWALWPTLPDLAVGLLVLTFLLGFRHTPAASSANKTIFYILIFVCLGCILSFIWYLTWVSDENAKGSSFGVYQIYRLVEFICVFWITAKIPLTLERINFLRRIVEAVLIFVCAGVTLTFFSIVPLTALTAHLPQSPGIAGPWSSYASIGRFGGAGWGTIGYHHAYVAAQVLMLVSLKIHLSLNKKQFSDSVLLLVSILICFLSESRAGLAAMLIFAIAYWFQKPIYAVVTAMVAVIGITAQLSAIETVNLTSAEGSVIERQTTLFEASDTENLSGRDQIWIDRITFLDEEPIRWLIGSGFGSAVDSGDNAHMLPLQIILETGLVGLSIFVFLLTKVLYYLYQCEPGVKAIFWVTIAFLVSSLTQDTFYPIPPLGHFIGLYLCSLAIALRSRGYEKERQQLALS